MPTQKIATHTIFRKAAQKEVFNNPDLGLLFSMTLTELSFYEIKGQSHEINTFEI
jgi:hypothetical protein